MSDRQSPAGEQNFRKNVQAATPAEEVDATDAAAQLAADNNIDISTVKGSGTDGRVLVSDVQAAIDARGQ